VEVDDLDEALLRVFHRFGALEKARIVTELDDRATRKNGSASGALEGEAGQCVGKAC